MQIYDCDLWQKDLDQVISNLPELSVLEGQTIMITGATGLVGSSVVDVIIRYNETHSQPIGLLVAGRSEDKARERFGRFCDRSYFRFVLYDATRDDNQLDFSCDYIVYGASNAYPAKILQEPVETMLGNFKGVEGLLAYAYRQHIKRFLYVSSSEVYGKKEGVNPYREDEYGYIDLLNPRNSYSIAKRAAETLCASFAEEYNVDSVIVRPGHIYGPTASENDNRVSSQWAFASARGEDIVMKSDGAQVRSYCYCLDCASAILKVLLRGESGKAYNISNPESVISIRQLAESYAKVGGVKVIFDLPTEKEKAAFNPMMNSGLKSDSLQGLGWQGLFEPDAGVEHTINILREMF